MPVYPYNQFTISHAVNGEGSSFATANSIESNNLVKIKFYVRDDKTTAQVNTFAKRSGLKAVAVHSESAITSLKLRAGTADIMDFGGLSAGQTKLAIEGVSLDFNLPSSGSDIDNVVITKAAGDATDNSGEINIEMYYNHSTSSS